LSGLVVFTVYILFDFLYFSVVLVYTFG